MDDPRHIFEKDLRGREYIIARGLRPKLKQQVEASEDVDGNLLPTVLNILEHWEQAKGKEAEQPKK